MSFHGHNQPLHDLQAAERKIEALEARWRALRASLEAMSRPGVQARLWAVEALAVLDRLERED